MLLRWLSKKHRMTINDVLSVFKQSNDFVEIELQEERNHHFSICYFYTLVDKEKLNRDLLPYLRKTSSGTLEELYSAIPISNKYIVENLSDLREKVLNGYVVVRTKTESQKCIVFDVAKDSNREVTTPEVEFSVVGPQEAFIEALDTNISLIRKRLPLSQLKVKELKIGKLTQTKVAVLYLDGIVDEENVQTMTQRLKDIEFDQILDSSSLSQMITDNSMSIFPQFINSERPERVAAALGEGKVAFLCDGSPEAVLGPSTLIEFFSSLEDYFLPWQIASTVRLLRFFAVSFSILATPIYVAVLTYHYELIPKDLLATIISSRSNIPFPPIIEAIFLELTIELLREAGARLPTKVGQTIGIVGGIVIGQASVEAGLTSNILLIIVALAALASFTTPVYQMGNTIRLIRFPFIITAAFLGGIGVVICVLYTLIHLLKLKSLGRPYLEPLYPPRFKDWRDAFIRVPYNWMSSRPVYLRPKQKKRLNLFQATRKHDIDE
ncbi:spore germination protein [Halalkalibacter urbisdiaboli]|uniref:spore germination protein n=1 Tax=Halalkalibacter urbisdiaboli TaxID=1960589 RepID=UPI000B435051|nr:spore germination protein [Halalkalibacter urbisdiaboli]